jgi:STE24 endopeptidase
MLAGAALWAWAASLLWRSIVPGNLHLPRVAPRTSFDSRFLHRSASFEELLAILAVAAGVVQLLVLGLYAWRGHRFMRESAAGRIGTGMMLGMLGLGLVWLAEVPFQLVAVWWERRYGVSHAGYASTVLSSFLALGGTFVSISLALLVAMGIAGVLSRRWWLAAAPAFAAIALLETFVSPYLVAETAAPRAAWVRADAQALARRERVAGVRVIVQRVHRYTTAPNAESSGFGPTRTVILWDTLLDGRFSEREVAVVIAHELGHLARDHPLRRVGWLALFLLPLAWLIARVVRPRGGMAQPQAVPLALFVLVAATFLATPLVNLVSRHEEAEADWAALQATRDPAAARALFQRLARSSLADPDPPSWSYILDADHPSIVQRIAMVRAWERLHARSRASAAGPSPAAAISARARGRGAASAPPTSPPRRSATTSCSSPACGRGRRSAPRPRGNPRAPRGR